jgi:creatinine amidohydrolase
MEHEFDHAGFVETSIMLAISGKVKMKKAKKGLITKGLSKEEIQRINKLSTEQGGFPKVAKNGVWGDPTGATKKDGEKFLAEIIRNLAKECQS